MRKLIFSMLLLATTFFTYGQINAEDLKKLKSKRVKNYLMTGSLVLLAGASDGVNQALVHKYGGVKKVFPNLNDQFWWPVKSAYNKYKNGDPEQGAKFPGSRTWLVFTTDGYHLTRFADHFLMSGAIAVKISGHEKKKWYMYLLELTGYWLINRAGFCITYNYFDHYQ